MSDVLEKTVSSSGANVTLTTTSETVIITSDLVRVPTQTARIAIKAWAQLNTGAGTTIVTVSIRRGSTVSGAVVGEANSEALKAAAGSTEPFSIFVTEDVSNVESVQYSLTLTQLAATGNGTAVQAAIEVEVLNG